MATFAELCADVYTITKRPNLVAETKLAVRRATVAAHQVDFFWKDIYETKITFNTAEDCHEIVYRNLWPRFRALKYLRVMDEPCGVKGFITVVQPESVLDSYGIDRINVCYAAGDSINIRLSEPVQKFVIGMYLHPNVDEESYASWIATEHPMAIILGAAEMVFKMIGKTEEFAAYRDMYNEERRNIVVSNLQAVGY